MLGMVGSHHVNRYKILKVHKILCWSNNVEAGSAVFMMMRSVFLLLGVVPDIPLFYFINTFAASYLKKPGA